MIYLVICGSDGEAYQTETPSENDTIISVHTDKFEAERALTRELHLEG